MTFNIACVVLGTLAINSFTPVAGEGAGDSPRSQAVASEGAGDGPRREVAAEGTGGGPRRNIIAEGTGDGPRREVADGHRNPLGEHAIAGTIIGNGGR